MIRLLIVLAVVAFAAFYLNYNTHRAPSAASVADGIVEPGTTESSSPQALYQQSTGEARALEQQVQQQAQDQLDAIDANSQ